MIINILKKQIEDIVAPLNEATSYDDLINTYWEISERILTGVDKMREDSKSFSKEECNKVCDFASTLLNRTYSAQAERIRKETREKWVF